VVAARTLIRIESVEGSPKLYNYTCSLPILPKPAISSHFHLCAFVSACSGYYERSTMKVVKVLLGEVCSVLLGEVTQDWGSVLVRRALSVPVAPHSIESSFVKPHFRMQR
jgi:hypothetical protein